MDKSNKGSLYLKTRVLEGNKISLSFLNLMKKTQNRRGLQRLGSGPYNSSVNPGSKDMADDVT